jgi:hypothetical protein
MALPLTQVACFAARYSLETFIVLVEARDNLTLVHTRLLKTIQLVLHVWDNEAF